MTVEAVPALGLHDEVAAPAIRTAGVPGAGFARAIAQGVQGLDRSLQASQADLQGLAVGEGPPLHELMVRLESSRIALQFALQVRNRALEAYQDVMRMQI